MKNKIIEITQKELDKKLGEERKVGYDMGVKHGRSEMLPWRRKKAVKGIELLDALMDFLDESYEPIKEVD